MTTSPDGTKLTPTSGGSLTDAMGNTYTMVQDAGQVASASIYLGGNFIPGSGGTAQCEIVGGVVWAENYPSGPWVPITGSTFGAPQASPPPIPPPPPPPPPPPTPTPTPTTTITAQLKAALAAVTDTVAQVAAAQTKLATDFAAASTVLTNDFNAAQAKINADLQSAVTQLNLLLTEI
jgi:hypothetical protein